MAWAEELGSGVRKLAKKLGINASAVQKHLDALKVKSVIKRVGPDKGGHWEISGGMIVV